jgi:hypothetical protein
MYKNQSILKVYIQRIGDKKFRRQARSNTGLRGFGTGTPLISIIILSIYKRPAPKLL